MESETVPLKQLDLKPSTKEALTLVRVEKCIKRNQATHLGGTRGCFMESEKETASCGESRGRSGTYLAAQNLLLSLQTFSQQFELRGKLLSPFSPLSQLTSQLFYRFLTTFQHLEGAR